MPGKYILAHDIGTEANKATLFDIQGKIVGLDSEVYGVNYPQPRWAEQNPRGLVEGGSKVHQEVDRQNRSLPRRGDCPHL